MPNTLPPLGDGHDLAREVVALRAHVAELQRRMARYDLAGETREMSGLEVSISEREELLVTAERIAHMGSWVWDVEHQKVSWSDELYRIFGCDPETEPGSYERFFQAIHPDDRERVREASHQVESTGEAAATVFRVLRPDGTMRYVQTDGAVIFDAQGKLRRIVGTILDITERHESELELAAARERLARAERLEMIGRLAGGIAHEFNNIMTVIHGGAELLTPGAPPDVAVLTQLKAAVASARELTTRLLAFGRQSTLRPQRVDPNQIARDTARLVARILGENVTVELELDPACPGAVLDPHLTGQALVNLLINARDAMPDGGRIALATNHGGPPEAPYVELIVRDQGPGIADDLRDRIFEPFFTTKPEGQGSGLGLAMVQGAVEQQGGSIVLASGPAGSEFTLRFPAAATAPAPAAPAPLLDAPGHATPGHHRILVVEDQDSLAFMVERLLRNAGHSVWVCTSPLEALELYRERRAEIDLILSDVLMPDLSGMELVERCAELGPLPRVLFMSGYGAEALRTVGEDRVVLPKPFTKAELLDTIAAVMDARGP